MRGGWGLIIGIVLFFVIVVSWFVWGPLGLIFYVGGLFNSLWLFMLSPFLFLLIPLAVVSRTLPPGHASCVMANPVVIHMSPSGVP